MNLIPTYVYFLSEAAQVITESGRPRREAECECGAILSSRGQGRPTASSGIRKLGGIGALLSPTKRDRFFCLLGFTEVRFMMEPVTFWSIFHVHVKSTFRLGQFCKLLDCSEGLSA